jgi:IS5 family transposase
MRKKHRIQRALTEAWLDLPYAKELEVIDDLLTSQSTIGELAAQDLIGGDPETGRPGITGEEAIRALVLKQANQWSYSELWFQLHDSQTSRAFMGYGIGDQVPSRSALAENIKKLRAETLESISRVVLDMAEKAGVEKGRKIRVDTTAVESNIHHPFESDQMWDVVRVLTRSMEQAKELTADELTITFADRTRRAKRRYRGAWNAKTKAKRREQYRDLLKVTREVMGAARRVAKLLEDFGPQTACAAAKVARVRGEILRVLALAEILCDTTQRRVINDEPVASTEKVLSIFEDHTDVIRKDRRETIYGHKICLTGGASSLILDCRVLEGNPADSSLAVDAVRRQEEVYGRLPRQVALDGGFASKINLADIKGLGVQDVAFSKRRGLEISDMAKSTWVYRRLRDFRAGIEGCISFLKRCFGLDRCSWRSFASFKAYVQASVLSFNLLVLARHLIA